MREDLMKMVRDLTQTDQKTLMGKALKMMEEVGELSGKVLPYSASHGTRHRFVTQADILEELADSWLVLMSMVVELGYSEDDLMDMAKKKAEKWAMLQAQEQNITNRIPFEIHITVDVDRALSSKENIDRFRQVCRDMDVKPILLDLHRQDDAVIKDMMTSSVFFGDNAGVIAEVNRIVDALVAHDFLVVRKKIETVPWHPAAPKDGEKMPEGSYFESHLNVVFENASERTLLEMWANANECHISKNAWKQNPDGSGTIMITDRQTSMGRESFQERVRLFVDKLKSMGFQVEKEIVEFSIWDTKTSHDNIWLGLSNNNA